MTPKLFARAACGFLLLAVAGCGGQNLHPISGKVTFPDGSPLTKGRVNFESDKHSASGQIQPDGSFEMTSLEPGDGVPPGTYKVTIGGAYEGTGGGAHGMFRPTKALVAKEFENPETTPLTYEVKDSDDSVTFQVEPAKK